MSAPAREHPGIERIKNMARWLKKLEGLAHSVALDKAAREQGYQNYQHARSALVPREAK